MRDAHGDLPLHLAVRHNSGDGALDVVRYLLATYRDAAAQRSAPRDAAGRAVRRELPVVTALRGTGIYQHLIILALAGACPEALTARDAAGGTLLHRVCALPHVTPGAARRTLEHVRGVSGALRAPEAAAHGNRVEHCAVYSLCAVSLALQHLLPQVSPRPPLLLLSSSFPHVLRARSPAVPSARPPP